MIEDRDQYRQMMNRLFDLEILGNSESEEFKKILKEVQEFEDSDLLTPKEKELI